MKTTLNEIEQNIAVHLAKKRISSSSERGQKNQRKSATMGAFETELEGMAAEIAFCKLHNIYIDTDLTPKDVDCVLHDGTSVDVKSTKHKNGKLICPHYRKKGAVDLYALLVGKFPSYELVGYATSDELMRPENLGHLGNPDKGQVYILTQDKLRKRYE